MAQGRGERARRTVGRGAVEAPDAATGEPAAGGHSSSHVAIGRVRAPKGLLGELKVEVVEEDRARLCALREVYLGDDLVRFAVRRVRLAPGLLLLQLEGMDDRDAAAQWSGATVCVLKDTLPLADDEYYCRQIEGLTAVTAEGEVLGCITEVLATGANDVYVVRGDAGEILLPAIKQVILRVDLGAGVLVVKLPDGLR